MTDIDRIEQRLAAVERTVTDGDHELNDIADLTDLADDMERLERRLDSIEERVAELEGVQDALDGYVSNVRSVNESIEQQAGAAYAAVDRLEERVDDLEPTVDGETAGSTPSGNASSEGDSTTVRTDSTNSNRTDLEQTVDDIVPEEEKSDEDEDDGLMSSLTDMFGDDESKNGSSEEAVPTAATGPGGLENGESPADGKSDTESEDEGDGFLSSLFK
jgi:chromosome segregation ATPase